MIWKSFMKVIARLEVHEILSLLMLGILTLLYELGLKDENLGDEIIRVAVSAGPITTTIALLMVLFFVVLIFVPHGRIAEHAKLLARVMASFLVMLFSFEAVTHFITAKGLPIKDAALQDWDSFLFGGKQPAEWLEPINNHPLTLFLSVIYLAWFAFTYGTIFLMWWSGRRALLEYTAAALMTFYIGYLIYILIPAFGPIFTYTYSTSMTGLTAMMMDRNIFTPVADAFPSLHTGISVIMFILVRKYSKRWFLLYSPVVVLVIISTIYLRIHYVIDVIAGVALALATAWLCRKLIVRWEKLQESIQYSGSVANRGSILPNTHNVLVMKNSQIANGDQSTNI
ncbi:phosphatase PAP2 family protein [Cohnella sp.]|uniref:phosphatase PAP2 family protein n=1 Tax=Cohnella sp. TaxID=1883426 RepID=UPI003568C4E3